MGRETLQHDHYSAPGRRCCWRTPEAGGVLTRCIIYSQNDTSVSERSCAGCRLWAWPPPPPTWSNCNWERTVLAMQSLSFICRV